MEPIPEVRRILQNFQDGYTARDISKLDEFMKLFLPGDQVELIGIRRLIPRASQNYVGGNIYGQATRI